MTEQEHRRPESVLVVVHTRDFEVLLLRRRRPAGYWQSVTGGLRWGESVVDAAVREVREETGLDAGYGLTDTGVINRYPPLPEFGHRFGPGVAENTEYVWTLELGTSCPVRIDPDEHDEYGWLSAKAAANKARSRTNRDAILALIPEASV